MAEVPNCRLKVWGGRAAAAALPLWLFTACSGESPSLPAAGAAGLSTEQATVTGAFPEAAPSPQKGAEPFNPFSDTPASATGGRTVIASPTLADIMQTHPGLPEMVLGRADAPVTIVQYASLTCPHCRNFHATVFPELKRAYIDTGKVRYILREFPIGKTSGTATVALRCASPDKYFALYGKYMEQQAQWVSQEVRIEPILKVAQQVGVTGAQLDACLKNQAMIEALKWVKERGRMLGVIGTPNFIIAGKLVKKELTMTELKALIDAALAGGVAQR